MPPKDIDLAVLGSTGFTGALVAKFLSTQTSAKYHLCGRSAGKLERLRQSLLSAKNPPAGVVVCDTSSYASCLALTTRSVVVLSLVGPFDALGRLVVAACVEGGCHYCDITGETPTFAKWSVSTQHAAAAAAKVKIVHCCGYDSVPSDVLAHQCVEAIRAAGGTPDYVSMAADGFETVGAPSTGTVSTALSISGAAMAAQFADPHFLDDAKRMVKGWWAESDVVGLWYEPGLKMWTTMFVMAPGNCRIVRRTHKLLDSPPFAYKEKLGYGRGIAGFVAAFCTLVGLSCCLPFCLPPLKWVVSALLPAGAGPTEAMRDGGKYTMRCHATGTIASSGKRIECTGTFKALNQDPGYKGTALLSATTALCVLDLAKGALKPAAQTPAGGVLTPVSATGGHLAARLRAEGLEISTATFR